MYKEGYIDSEGASRVREDVGEENVYNDWLYDFSVRVIVPKSIVQQHRGILSYKSYFEVMGLPIDILSNEIHMYCNQILVEDLDMIKTLQPMGLVVEPRDEAAQEYLNSIGV
jgi:hypothetical protein